MTQAPQKRRRRRLLFAAIALGLGLGAALVVLEVVLRIAWNPPAQMAEFQQKGLYCDLPSGNAGLVPGYRGTLQLVPTEPVTRIAIDSLGMRGPEPGDRRPGERRVLVVGDSMVFGYGVDEEQTFVRALEANVRTSGHDVTIGNGGISGFNSYEAARRIGDLRPGFAPDAILYCCYLGNDAFENRNTDVVVCGGLRFAGPNARLMQRSMRARWMARSRLCLWLEGWVTVNAPSWSLLPDLIAAWPNPALEGFPGSPGQPGLDGCLFLDTTDENAAWPAGAPAVLPRVLADFRSAFAAAKAAADPLPIHVLILPALCHCSDEEHAAGLRAAGFDPAGFQRGLIQRRLRAIAAELGLPVLDATPWLAAETDLPALFVSDRGHFSPRGHAVVAAHLARELAPLWR